ncbi:MFS transporter [Streptomyces sp. NPDC021020]|uniref:MFS transporter n=1 Tax=Streptomyces sp. NPDC021020 TaxID=3365109 RepID=UPI0037A89B9C
MGLPRAVRVLLLARVVNRLGAFSVPFLAALLTTDFHTGLASAGLVTAAFGLASIPSRLIGGRLADSLGARRTVVLGLTGCSLAQLGLAAARSLPAAALAAVVLGLAFELYEPPSQALLADLAGPAGKVRAFSLFNAALALGGIGAGLLAALLGRWDLRWLFVADAVSCLLCAALVRFAVPADRRADHPDGPPAAAASPWRDRRLLVMLALGTGYALLCMQTLTMLPLSLAARGLHTADAGLIFTVSAVTVICAQPLLRLRRVAELPAHTALLAGHLLLAAGLLGYAAAHGLPAAAAATVPCGLGELLVMGRAYALVADLAPPAATGRYLAVFGTCWGFAGVAAPLLGTQVLARTGPGPLWSAMAALALALAAAQLLTPRPPLARAPANGPAVAGAGRTAGEPAG